MNAVTYSAAGAKSASKTTLAKDIFDVEVKNHELVKEAYNAYLANGRANLAVTKTRGLVRGGGKKPWRQKGTGRARFGSSRNPIWRGGGIVFGPTGNENYTKNLNIKAKRLALKQALTLVAAGSKVIVIEDIKLKTHKTSELAKLVKKLDLTGNSLLVVDSISKELSLASSNIPNVLLCKTTGLNVFDVLNADHIVMTKPALKELGYRLEVK
ncbi:MAG TPA: 50S ribosomal protein L4 [Candidatus Saccharimonadales bacterium]|jgi:large subunit ribosomal protein L4